MWEILRNMLYVEIRSLQQQNAIYDQNVPQILINIFDLISIKKE